MKFPWTVVAVLAAQSLTAMPKTAALIPGAGLENNYRWSSSIESDVKARLEQLNMPFEIRYDATVRQRIKEYVTNGYRDTEIMLGRSSVYFPIFEHYLHLYGLPQELRYLPIVETGLAPKARSYAGAAGLWQFMPASARLYDLKVNGQVDERLDPYRSTEAAVRMLGRLYKQYKDWSLVLAAYNCGPVRVNAAIKQAGCRDFYTLAEFLPRETREYVPRFIAAAYIANYYSAHDLKPKSNDWINEELRAVRVTELLPFSEIAHITGLSVQELRRLNPAFQQNVIPVSKQGYLLLLPVNAYRPFEVFLNSRNGVQEEKLDMLYPTLHRMYYVVRPGETMEYINRRFQCTPAEVQRWNQLPTPEVTVNQELLLYVATPDYLARP